MLNQLQVHELPRSDDEKWDLLITEKIVTIDKNQFSFSLDIKFLVSNVILDQVEDNVWHSSSSFSLDGIGDVLLSRKSSLALPGFCLLSIFSLFFFHCIWDLSSPMSY